MTSRIFLLLESMLNEVSESVLNKVREKFVSQGSDESDVSSLLERFQTLQKKNQLKGVDILAFKSFKDLKATLDSVSDQSKSEVKKSAKSEGSELVFENDLVRVYKILTHDASCLIGSGTKWCTTSEDPTSFKHYTKAGALYYLIPKDGSDKWAVNASVDGLEVFDVKDNGFPISKISGFKVPVGVFDKTPTHKFSWAIDGKPDENGDVDVSNSQLTSLVGAPKSVGGDFACRNNKRKFTEKDVRAVCDVKGEVFV